MIVVRWLRRLFFLLVFVVIFAYEILVANLRVAYEVLTPGYQMSAAIVRVPTSLRNPTEATLLANAITMTPGTLTLEIDPTNYDLYVHSLYVTSIDDFRRSIGGIERRLVKALR
jgi:multicomponent Na+:H+ antiporter subunit E